MELTALHSSAIMEAMRRENAFSDPRLGGIHRKPASQVPLLRMPPWPSSKDRLPMAAYCVCLTNWTERNGIDGEIEERTRCRSLCRYVFGNGNRASASHHASSVSCASGGYDRR